MRDIDYGQCPECHCDLVPIWFKEKETKIKDGHLYYTGRVRRAVSHLICPECLTPECVDDSFDWPWEYERKGF